jgi:hypothetical protein
MTAQRQHREWTLPGGVTLRTNDLVELMDADYRYGRGVLRLRVEHVGDSLGRIPADTQWVSVIGHEVHVDGTVGAGRQVAVRVQALRPIRATT